MSTTALYFIAGILIIGIIYWYYLYWFIFLKKLYKVPCLKPWPILGHAFDVLPVSNMINNMKKFRKVGKTFKMILLYEISIQTSDQKFIEYVSTSKDFITKSVEYDFLRPWLNDGLLTSTGKKWFQRRKLLTPSFHFEILENFIAIFNNCGQILIDKLRNEVGNKSFDIYPYITLCTLDVIYESTMGVKINAQNQSNSEYVQAVKGQSRIVVERMVHFLKRNPFFYQFYSDSSLEKRLVKILHDATDKIIMTRRDLLLKNSTSLETKRKCFMDILLQSTVEGKPLTNADIREEVDTFLFEASIAFTACSAKNSPKPIKLD